MNKNYIRIDDNLIHGRIIANWSNYLNIDNIISVDDKTASNPMLKSIILMSVPRSYKTYICKTHEFTNIISNLDKKDSKNFIIARFPNTLRKIFDCNIKAESINIGTVSKKNTSIFEITPNVYLTKNDVTTIEEIYEKGNEIIFQLLPNSQKLSWSKIRENYIT